MTLLALDSVSKSFGSRLVLDGLELEAGEGARLGIVGANGSGKSTLLRLLAGLEEPDAGRVVRQRGVVTACLAQHPLGDGRTTLEMLLAARPELARLEHELAATGSGSGAPRWVPTSRRLEAAIRRFEDWAHRVVDERHIKQARLKQRQIDRMEKTLVGELEPAEGEVWVGPSIRVGYLAQDQETVEPELSPLQTVRAAHPCTEREAVALLATFLFPYEQVRRPDRLLSGGERTRPQLLLRMLSGANLLVLDEPMSHLDIDSVETLETALEPFEGTVVAISHDRYFLDRIADRILEVADGDATAFEGGYSDWFERRARPVAA